MLVSWMMLGKTASVFAARISQSQTSNTLLTNSAKDTAAALHLLLELSLPKTIINSDWLTTFKTHTISYLCRQVYEQ